MTKRNKKPLFKRDDKFLSKDDMIVRGLPIKRGTVKTTAEWCEVLQFAEEYFFQVYKKRFKPFALEPEDLKKRRSPKKITNIQIDSPDKKLIGAKVIYVDSSNQDCSGVLIDRVKRMHYKDEDDKETFVSGYLVKDDKLKITRRGDFIMLGGKFPRLTKKDSKARIKEIQRLLLAI